MPELRTGQAPVLSSASTVFLAALQDASPGRALSGPASGAGPGLGAGADCTAWETWAHVCRGHGSGTFGCREGRLCSRTL